MVGLAAQPRNPHAASQRHGQHRTGLEPRRHQPHRPDLTAGVRPPAMRTARWRRCGRAVRGAPAGRAFGERVDVAGAWRLVGQGGETDAAGHSGDDPLIWGAAGARPVGWRQRWELTSYRGAPRIVHQASILGPRPPQVSCAGDIPVRSRGGYFRQVANLKISIRQCSLE